MLKKNRFEKVLLVNLYYKESGYGEKLNFPPIGLAYLSEILSTNHIEHEVIDTGTGKTQEDIFSLIQTYSPDLVCFSLNSIRATYSFQLIKKIKELYPNISIATGGPHINTKRELILQEHPQIDFAVCAEGEYPLIDLIKKKPLKEISGLIFRDNNKIISNEVVSYEIDSYPFPKYEKFDLTNNYQGNAISILTSRGCPYLCAFCQQSSLLGKKWRGRSAQNVVEEIEYWYKKGVKEIHILDDMFALSHSRVEEIQKLLNKKGINDLHVFLIGGLRVRNSNEKLLSTLKKLGVTYLSFGIESATNRILEKIKKGMTIEEAHEIVDLATKMDFKVRLFFILGFPTQTFNEALESFDFALKYPIYEARFFNLIPYEHTGIMNWIKDNNINMLYEYNEYMDNFKSFQRIPLFEDAEGMSIEEKEKVLKMADEVIAQINKKQAQRASYK